MTANLKLVFVSGLEPALGIGSQALSLVGLCGYDYANSVWMPISIDNLGNAHTSGART